MLSWCVWRCLVTQEFLALKVFKVFSYSEGLFFISATCEFNSLLSCCPMCQELTGSVSHHRRWQPPSVSPKLRRGRLGKVWLGRGPCTLPSSKASGSLQSRLVFSKGFRPLCSLSLTFSFLHFASSCSPMKVQWIWGQQSLSLQLFTCGLLLPAFLVSRCLG